MTTYVVPEAHLEVVRRTVRDFVNRRRCLLCGFLNESDRWLCNKCLSGSANWYVCTLCGHSFSGHPVHLSFKCLYEYGHYANDSIWIQILAEFPQSGELK